MNILITGITGSGGSYLAEYLVDNQPDVNVYGIHRWHSTGVLTNIEKIKDKIKIIECDLLDLSSVIRALEISKPKKIFHLAAFANVKKCFETPLAVINNNIMGTANLLEGVRLVCPNAVMQMCSTSEVNGNALINPITEDHPLNPVNPYAVSKLAAEKLSYAYHKSWHLNVVITRAFCYINPRRHDLFATAFAMQIARIENGMQEVLKHGNLNSGRTIIDVREISETYWLASEKCEFGIPYNIGGETPIQVGEVLEILKSKAKVKIKSELDPALLRPTDITKQFPDVTKFKKATGWVQKISPEESLNWLLEECRKDVVRQKGTK